MQHLERDGAARMVLFRGENGAHSAGAEPVEDAVAADAFGQADLVVTGKLATNVDIGAGYAYDAMIEDASVAK